MNTAFTPLCQLGAGAFHCASKVQTPSGVAVYRCPNDLAAMTGLDGLRREVSLHTRLFAAGAPVVPVIEADESTCEQLVAFAEPVVNKDVQEASLVINSIRKISQGINCDEEDTFLLEFLLQDALHDGSVNWAQFGMVKNHLVLLDI